MFFELTDFCCIAGQNSATTAEFRPQIFSGFSSTPPGFSSFHSFPQVFPIFPLAVAVPVFARTLKGDFGCGCGCGWDVDVELLAL